LTRKILILIFIFAASLVFSQDDTINFTFEDYTFTSIYDTANYCSVLKITRDNSVRFESECTDRFFSITAEDLDSDSKKEILMEQYTGGAHCCSYLVACRIENDHIMVLDSIWWGDSGYEIQDIKNDGKKELVGVKTWFAYAFTNFADSRFNVVIYKFKSGKFYDATSEFPDIIKADIKDLKSQLKEYIDKGFDCPRQVEDTFNTDAGAVKAILAPIVADYYNLGELEEGYNYVKKVYKCNDVTSFIKILVNDYKLK